MVLHRIYERKLEGIFQIRKQWKMEYTCGLFTEQFKQS